MVREPTALKLREDQVLHFRARRSHLAGPGAATLREAAHAILGAPSPQLGDGLMALWQRTASRPTAAEIQKALFEEPRSLVQTWGQRDSLHLYDPRDWPRLVAARERWSGGGRPGPKPPAPVVDAALGVLDGREDGVTRRHVQGVVPASYLTAVEELARKVHLAPERFAAGRLLWTLSQRGDACAGPRIGAAQSYGSRRLWYPELRWPRRLADPFDANVELCRRYLATYGPATAQDAAHFLGARVSDAREWFDGLGEEGALIDVQCAGRPTLFALTADERELRQPAPPGPALQGPSAQGPTPGGEGEWPVRLLPPGDSLLLAHADKRWTAPDPLDEKQIWRKAGHVCAVVLSRGRGVATWTHTVRRDRLEVEIQSLSGWRKIHRPLVQDQTEALARHLELGEARTRLES